MRPPTVPNSNSNSHHTTPHTIHHPCATHAPSAAQPSNGRSRSRLFNGGHPPRERRPAASTARATGNGQPRAAPPRPGGVAGGGRGVGGEREAGQGHLGGVQNGGSVIFFFSIVLGCWGVRVDVYIQMGGKGRKVGRWMDGHIHTTHLHTSTHTRIRTGCLLRFSTLGLLVAAGLLFWGSSITRSDVRTRALFFPFIWVFCIL